jgi:hypothetical protein
VRNGVFGLFAEWLDRELRQREVEAHWIERLENALIENDIEVARRSLRPDNAEDGESNSEEEGQGKWRMVNGLLVPVVDVDVGRDDYWDKHLNQVVLVCPILADTDRVLGQFLALRRLHLMEMQRMMYETIVKREIPML